MLGVCLYADSPDSAIKAQRKRRKNLKLKRVAAHSGYVILREGRADGPTSDWQKVEIHCNIFVTFIAALV